MQEALILVALLVANAGGIGDVLGVSPGVVAGQIVYPNHTSIGYVLDASGLHLYPWLAGVLDAGYGALLGVDRQGNLLVVYDGRGYIIGLYRRSMPPYTVLAGGLVGVTGALLYPNGTLVAYRLGGEPLTPVALAWNESIVLKPAGYASIIARGSKGLVYRGVALLSRCGEMLAGVTEDGGIALLAPNNTLIVLGLKGLRIAWGKTLDTSILSCSNGRLAALARVNKSLGIIVIDVDSLERGSCAFLTLAGEPRAVGVALNGSKLTLGYAAVRPLRLERRECSYTIRRLTVEPEEVELSIARYNLSPVKMPPPLESRNETSLIAPNVILSVYELAGAQRTPTPGTISTSSVNTEASLAVLQPLLALAVAVLLVAVALLAARTRFGGVRSTASPGS